MQVLRNLRVLEGSPALLACSVPAPMLSRGAAVAGGGRPSQSDRDFTVVI